MNALRLAFAVAFCFCLGACEYHFGTGPSSQLNGTYHVGKLANRTAYRDLDIDLQAGLVDSLRRHGARIKASDDAQTKIWGTILSVDKLDRESNETGQVLETQVIINFQMMIKEENGEVRQVVFNNRDYRSSSGIYRSDKGKAEQDGIADALLALSEQAYLRLSPSSW